MGYIKYAKILSMILYINTKDQRRVEVAIKERGKVVKSLSEKNEYGSQVLLPLIVKLLRTYNPGLEAQIQTGIDNMWEGLEGIEVETGPGSFTGLRVGVSVANALGFALGIPVNGKRAETDLVYG